MNSSDRIKKFLLDNLSFHQRDIIQTAISRFGISRQAVLRHMNALIEDKQVDAYGKTRDRFYELRPQVNFNKKFSLRNKFSPKVTTKEYCLNHLKSLPKNIRDICEFSCIALLNNIIDHSQANNLYLKLYLTYEQLHLVITDDGVGLFGHIKRELDLNTCQIAAIEVSKGYITTDPNNHSGDELNTVIHLFDKVAIDASGISLSFVNDINEWKIDHSSQKKGTRIHLQIDPNSKRACGKIFQKLFTDIHNQVRIPINLVKMPGDDIISTRSEAQIMLNNIRDFEEIEFDFRNIDLVGPAFADELIRKTKLINKAARIKWINCNKTVNLLMSRAYSRKR